MKCVNVNGNICLGLPHPRLQLCGEKKKQNKTILPSCDVICVNGNIGIGLPHPDIQLDGNQTIGHLLCNNCHHSCHSCDMRYDCGHSNIHDCGGIGCGGIGYGDVGYGGVGCGGVGYGGVGCGGVGYGGVGCGGIGYGGVGCGGIGCDYGSLCCGGVGHEGLTYGGDYGYGGGCGCQGYGCGNHLKNGQTYLMIQPPHHHCTGDHYNYCMEHSCSC